MSEAEAMRLALQMSSAGMAQRSGEDGNGSGGLQRLVEDGGDPALLTAAIMASHQHYPGALRQPPRPPTEEEALAQAIRATKNEEEQRNRARLRDEQESEYAESELIDRAKKEERLKREREEEEKRKAEEEEKLKAELAEKARREHIAALIEEARARLREEPPKEEKSRVTVKVNTPQGRALKRTFRCEDRVSQIYDYVVAEGGEEFAFGRFRLLQGMPRTLYEDKAVTLQTAGLQGQCALLVQVIESDDEEEVDSGNRKPDQASSSTALPTPEQEVSTGGVDRDQACSSTAPPRPEQEKPHSDASPTPEQEAERVAAARAEAERLEKVEAERVAAARAEAERLEKAEADRLAAEREEVANTKADDSPVIQAPQETPVADSEEVPQPSEIPGVETPDQVQSAQQPLA